MDVATARFGPVTVEADSEIEFPGGLLGFEDCRRWVFVSDGRGGPHVWLQSLDRPELALAVVHPRRFLGELRLRVARPELGPLELDNLNDAQVLVIVGRSDDVLTLNLRAPLIINTQRRLGRQVITNGELPLRYELRVDPCNLRRSA